MLITVIITVVTTNATIIMTFSHLHTSSHSRSLIVLKTQDLISFPRQMLLSRHRACAIIACNLSTCKLPHRITHTTPNRNPL